MTITLTLPPSLEQQLVSAAEARNIPLQDYVLSLVQDAVPPQITPAPNAANSHEHFLEAMGRLSQSATPPAFPDETWSRATIYGDHA